MLNTYTTQPIPFTFLIQTLLTENILLSMEDYPCQLCLYKQLELTQLEDLTDYHHNPSVPVHSVVEVC